MISTRKPFPRSHGDFPSQRYETCAFGIFIRRQSRATSIYVAVAPFDCLKLPSHEEIRTAATVLTDDRIAELRRGLVSRELVIKRILEAAEQLRAGEHS